MQKITSFPASQSLSLYIDDLCPLNQHIHVVSLEVYADDEYNGRFTGLFMSAETSYVNIVRHFTVKGVDHYTLEKWEHDNGYRCKLVVITEDQFNLYIQLKGIWL